MKIFEAARSLYIHIPFCTSKCDYCSFCSYAGQKGFRTRYLNALVEEIAALDHRLAQGPLETIFFGGGTPTLLAAEALEMLVARCREKFGIADGAEISVEANPGTVTRGTLQKLRQVGFTRISFGIQSFADSELRLLGRSHNVSQGHAAYEAARSAGFDNINLDLMYGIPGQGVHEWQENLEMALKFAPEHLSLYELTLEPGTPLARRVARGELMLPEEEEILKMDHVTQKATQAAGFEKYEVSNYCRPGYSCRHNINYWQNMSYFAVGAGAVSYLANCRARRITTLRSYCEAMEQGCSPFVETETLNDEQRFRETVIMGLRMCSGVSREALFSRFHVDMVSYYGKTLQSFRDQGLLEVSKTAVKVSPRGRPVLDHILAELV